MESRMEKYYTKDLSNFERIKKNQDLYKDISKEISDLDNLPIPDNSNEIDLNGLKQIIYSRDEYRKKNREELPSRDERVEVPEEKDSRIYDINVLLENAKNEINRSIEVDNGKRINHNFLTNLEEEKLEFEKEVLPTADEAMEISDEVVKKDDSGDSLPLDILMDLKGSDDTAVTDPIVKDDVTMIKKIKDGETFYSGSFNFSKKDFDDDDDSDFEEEDKYLGLKVAVIVVVLLLLAVGIYFVLTNYIL